MIDENMVPCPFCGSTDLTPSANGDGGQWWTCDGCMADGPYAETEADRDRLWNQRADTIPIADINDIDRVD